MALANDDVIKTFPSDRAAGLGQLTGKPFRIGMGCHTQPQKLTA
jgi:hypothetical protein